MAIDTPSKRKSCIGLAILFLGTGVIPDGSDLSASQRLHADALYSGISASAPAVVTAATFAFNLNINTGDNLNLSIHTGRSTSLNIETGVAINLGV